MCNEIERAEMEYRTNEARAIIEQAREWQKRCPLNCPIGKSLRILVEYVDSLTGA